MIDLLTGEPVQDVRTDVGDVPGRSIADLVPPRWSQTRVGGAGVIGTGEPRHQATVLQSLYDVGPDATALAHHVTGTLTDTTPLHQWVDRGLDHGAFIPLMAMYPAADVPVIQLSMPSLDPVALLALGERLRHLRDQGVLIIGSGFMTHSFAVMRDPRLLGHITAFDEWAADALSRGDVDALTDYQHEAPGAGVAHPTADHFVPLLLTLGAAHDPNRVTNAIERITFGNSIRSLQVA